MIELDYADDRPDETDEMKFKRHNRFLRSLREDPFLDVMLKYRCRILFTTRCRYEKHICLEIGELEETILSDLVSKFFAETEKHQTEIDRIIKRLHGHTFAVELAAGGHMASLYDAAENCLGGTGT